MIKRTSELKPIELLGELKNITNINSEKLALSYLIYGEEFFVWDRAVQRIKSIFKDKANIERVNFADINISEWVEQLNNFSLFSSFRIIIASDLNDLKEQGLQSLLAYLKNPSKDVLLLIYAEGIDRRKKTQKLILENLVSCNASHQRDNELSKWINGFAAERGKKIDFEASEFLRLRFSNDLSSIEKEIEKLALYFQEQKTISRKDVEYISAGHTGASIFDLFPALAYKNKEKLFSVLFSLLKDGENIIMLNSMILGRVKKMLLAKDLINSSMDDTKLSSELGIHKYYLDHFKDELKNFNKKDLEKMFLKCLDIDASLKSSSVNKNDILINGVLDLCKKEN